MKMTADEKAFKFYFMQTGKSIADNSRPDMVIGYVGACRELQEDIETWKRLIEVKEAKIKELETKLELIKKTIHS